MSYKTLPYESDEEFYYNINYRDFKDRTDAELMKIIKEYEMEYGVTEISLGEQGNPVTRLMEFETARYKAAKAVLEERIETGKGKSLSILDKIFRLAS